MKARQYLDDHLDETVTLEQLGQLVGMSPFHLQRTFKKVVGVSPKAYIAALRLRRMKAELRKGVTVSRATYDEAMRRAAAPTSTPGPVWV